MHHYVQVIVDNKDMGTHPVKDIEKKFGKLRFSKGVKFVDKWLSDEQVQRQKAEGRRQKAEGRRKQLPLF